MILIFQHDQLVSGLSEVYAKRTRILTSTVIDVVTYRILRNLSVITEIHSVQPMSPGNRFLTTSAYHNIVSLLQSSPLYRIEQALHQMFELAVPILGRTPHLYKRFLNTAEAGPNTNYSEFKLPQESSTLVKHRIN